LTGKNIDKLYQTSIAGICEDDCVLFFWVKTHQLKEGIKICETVGIQNTLPVWSGTGMF